MSGGVRFLASSHAFTLAEVLVTLGIIGVVSAMTVPSLMQNHQKKTYVTQLHKVYNEISQAVTMYLTDKNALNLAEAGINSNAKAQEFITDYFKIVQTCENSLTPCFANSYKYLNSTDDVNVLDGHSSTSFVLANGASVRPIYVNDGKISKVMNILVDTNGQKGPNILGRDTFYMAVYSSGAIDTFNYNAVSLPLTEDERNSADANWKPFGQILNDNWEMNY